MIQRPVVSLEAIKFPTSREYEVRMMSQYPSGRPFLGVHNEALFTKIICLRRQSDILWQRRAGFRLV